MTNERGLLIQVTDELSILLAAWLIASDDDRRKKPLFVSPKTAKHWKDLIARSRQITRRAVS